MPATPPDRLQPEAHPPHGTPPPTDALKGAGADAYRNKRYIRTKE